MCVYIVRVCVCVCLCGCVLGIASAAPLYKQFWNLSVCVRNMSVCVFVWLCAGHRISCVTLCAVLECVCMCVCVCVCLCVS